MVDRYGCFVGTNDYQKMAAADDGAWVKYSDYEELEAKLAALVKAAEKVVADTLNWNVNAADLIKLDQAITVAKEDK